MKTTVFEDEQVYICHDGRELKNINTEKKNKMVIHKHMKYMDVLTVVDVNISLNACTNIILIKMLIKIK